MPPSWLDAVVPIAILTLTETLLVRRRFAKWRRAAPHRCMRCSPVWHYLLVTSQVIGIAALFLAALAAVARRHVLTTALLMGGVFFLLRVAFLERAHQRAGHQLPHHPHGVEWDRIKQKGEGA